MLVNKPIVWSIAGSDCSGGAGIQADNQVIQAFNGFACNIITCVTAQNSEGVIATNPVSVEVFQSQCLALLSEYPPAVIKLGALPNEAIIDSLIAFLEQEAFADVAVVCDPVLFATAGGEAMGNEQGLQRLMPYLSALTPNQQEFQRLFSDEFDQTANSAEILEQQALEIARQYQMDIIITGGESMLSGRMEAATAKDCCVIAGEVFWLSSPVIATTATHGTGCSFASSIAAALACDYVMLDAVVIAKAYINKALALQVSVSSSASKQAFNHAGFPDALSLLPSFSRQIENTATLFPVIDQHSLGPYPVVDSLAWLEKCLQQGIKTLQLRMKDKTDEQMDLVVAQAAELGRKYNARLFINDYWSLAIKHKAYGVHLGQEDLDIADITAIAASGLHLGISTHSWYEIARAHSLKPSYIAIGPIYDTPTKQMPFAPQGLQQLQQWVALIGPDYPVVAIGGIDLGNAKEVLATGVGSVAMVRAVTEAADYKKAIADFQALF
ncbi:MAG: thiamine phosphate synthase [Pseudomonadales bacterium]|nr:thiamine phosphate synthase [Pseudomonadales bacterium]